MTRRRKPIRLGPPIVDTILLCGQAGKSAENDLEEILAAIEVLIPKVETGKVSIHDWTPAETKEYMGQLWRHIGGARERREYLTERIEEWNAERDRLRAAPSSGPRHAEALALYERGPIEALCSDLAAAFTSGYAVGLVAARLGVEPIAEVARGVRERARHAANLRHLPSQVARKSRNKFFQDEDKRLREDSPEMSAEDREAEIAELAETEGYTGTSARNVREVLRGHH